MCFLVVILSAVALIFSRSASSNNGSSENVEVRRQRYLDNINMLDFHYGVKPDGSVCIYDYTPTKIITEIAIPDKIDGMVVTELDGTFTNNSDLEIIMLPETITTIGVDTFNGCASLKEISIASKSLIIEEGAFANCAELSSMDFSRGTVCFRDKSIYNCSSLKDVILPNNIIIDGTNNFKDCNGNLIVYCAASSTAQQYCLANNIAFKTVE